MTLCMKPIMSLTTAKVSSCGRFAPTTADVMYCEKRVKGGPWAAVGCGSNLPAKNLAHTLCSRPPRSGVVTLMRASTRDDPRGSRSGCQEQEARTLEPCDRRVALTPSERQSWQQRRCRRRGSALPRLLPSDSHPPYGPNHCASRGGMSEGRARPSSQGG